MSDIKVGDRVLHREEGTSWYGTIKSIERSKKTGKVRVGILYDETSPDTIAKVDWPNVNIELFDETRFLPRYPVCENPSLEPVPVGWWDDPTLIAELNRARDLHVRQDAHGEARFYKDANDSIDAQRRLEAALRSTAIANITSRTCQPPSSESEIDTEIEAMRKDINEEHKITAIESYKTNAENDIIDFFISKLELYHMGVKEHDRVWRRFYDGGDVDAEDDADGAARVMDANGEVGVWYEGSITSVEIGEDDEVVRVGIIYDVMPDEAAEEVSWPTDDVVLSGSFLDFVNDANYEHWIRIEEWDRGLRAEPGPFFNLGTQKNRLEDWIDDVLASYYSEYSTPIWPRVEYAVGHSYVSSALGAAAGEIWASGSEILPNEPLDYFKEAINLLIKSPKYESYELTLNTYEDWYLR